MNTIDNIQNVVITGLVFVLGVKANVFGLKNSDVLINFNSGYDLLFFGYFFQHLLYLLSLLMWHWVS